MQNCGTALLAILESATPDLVGVDLFEFYAPDETCLIPENAIKRFAATELIWYGYRYSRQAISRKEISRYYDGRFNSVDVTLSNIDLSVSTWLATTEIEGYRLKIRMVSRSVDDDSVTLGVFRCNKPEKINKRQVNISATQDLGSIENTLPWGELSPKCIVTFKGLECLAGQLLAAKSATYQAASICNKTDRQCIQYDNRNAIQAIIFNAVKGNFKVSQARGGAGGAFLGLLGLGNKRVTKQYSSQESGSIGQVYALGMGRTQIELTPVVYADTGQYLAGQWIGGEGEVTKLLNVRNVSSGWATTFQAYAEHLGKYGFESSQAPVGFFTSTGNRYSHKWWVEATILGTNPDTGDAAPTLVAVCLWLKIPTFDLSCFTGNDWSDNAVEHLRVLLTEPRSLNYNSAWIDNAIAADTAANCNEPVIDQTGGEDFYVSTGSGTPGVDFKRYRSTGILDTHYFRKVLGLTTTYPAEKEVTYNTFNPATGATPTPSTYYRKRYTSNWHIREPIKAVDFIFKSLLPSFRGYLVTGADGRLQIKNERPVLSSLLRAAVSAGITVVQIEDVLAWKNLALPAIFALIGVGQATSETRRVSSIDFSTAGNSITLVVATTGGVTLTRSAATLAGGTTSIQSQGQVTVGGSPAAGNTATVTIDGVAVIYTLNANDTTGTVAAMLAVMINADLTLNRFVQAIWTPTLPNEVILRSKLGVLNLSAGLTSAHAQTETVAHVHMPFSDVAFGALSAGNIQRDSFDYPLGNKQTSYNQFVINFADAVQDYQPTKLTEEDEAHREKVNRPVPLEISGACVDNYHQASRLVLGARYKFRVGDYFTQLSSTGLALLLEEGDTYCVSHTSMPGKRNLLMRIEELKISEKHEVSIVGRLYADSQFPTTAAERTIVQTTGIGWPSAVPGAVTTLILSSPAAGTITGTFAFAGFVGPQTARIEVKREGETSFSDSGLRITPDAAGDGNFTITGLPAGITMVRIIPFSGAGDGPATESAHDSAAPAIQVLEYQIFDYPDESLEVEVFS